MLRWSKGYSRRDLIFLLLVPAVVSTYLPHTHYYIIARGESAAGWSCC